NIASDTTYPGKRWPGAALRTRRHIAAVSEDPVPHYVRKYVCGPERTSGELSGIVVEVACGVGIGLGHQLDASRRHRLRNLVHLRCNGQAVVAFDDGEQDQSRRIRRHVERDARPRVQ